MLLALFAEPIKFHRMCLNRKSGQIQYIFFQSFTVAFGNILNLCAFIADCVMVVFPCDLIKKLLFLELQL